MNVLRITPVVLMLVACNGATKEIDDPQMEATGNATGASTLAVANVSADADESTIQGAVSPISNYLYTLVGQHNAYAATNGGAPEASEAFAQQDGSGTVSWDGTRLLVDTSWDSDGFEYVYEVDLTFTAAGEGFSVDGHYDLLFTADYGGFQYDYDIQAEYDALTSDAAGCAISGSFSVNYKLKSSLDIPGLPTGNGNESGVVRVEFDGCNNATVFGSK